MSYVEKNLMNGEVVIHRSRLHWIVLVKPAFLLLIAGLFYMFGWAIAGHIVTAYVGFKLTVALVNMLTSEFAITNKRVIMKRGVLSRSAMDMLLNKVESFMIGQDLTGRWLRYGTVKVMAAGTGELFHDISDPLLFQRRMYEQIDNHKKFA